MKTFKITNPKRNCEVAGYTFNDKNPIEIKGEDLEISDEYHTMSELYDHRMALNIALFKAWQYYVGEDYIKLLRSKLHADGTMFEGYFIVMAITPVGQISYHYKLKHWGDFDFLNEWGHAPEWDGHGSREVLERLKKI